MATREQFGIDVLVSPKIDKKAATTVTQKLAELTTSFVDIGKQTTINIRGIKQLSTGAADFAKGLSQAAKVTAKDLALLGKQLEEAKAQAEALSKGSSKGGGKRKSDKEIQESIKLQSDLNKQINAYKSAHKDQIDEIKRVTEAHKKQGKAIQDSLRVFDTLKQIVGASKQTAESIKRGDLGGIVGGIKGGVDAGKGLHTRAVNKVQAAEAAGQSAGAFTKMLAGMGTTLAVLGGLAVALGAFVALIAAASSHQAKLNKTLLAGTGTVNDFYGSTDKYRKGIDTLRNAATNTSKEFLKLGSDSEKNLKIVNAYMRESTGSFGKTANMLEEAGGTVDRGFELFSKNAIVYGAALGMEAEEVAGMMGKMTTEVGYGANQVQDLMGNIVKSAATANMPVTKFMDIFRSVTPHVELFTNRIETLTGMIAMLGKNMRPEDIKKFMNAFGKGMDEESFRSRLKKVLVGGVGETNKLLEKELGSKIQIIAKGLDAKGLGNELRSAFKSGDVTKFQELVTKAKGAGTSASEIGSMTKLFYAELERKKGGPLHTATAAKSGGMMTQIRSMENQVRNLSGLDENEQITAISEHVAEQLGYSQEEINAFNALKQTTGQYLTSVKAFGTTGSKAADTALQTLAVQQGLLKEGETSRENMAKMAEKMGKKEFEDMLILAYEQANNDKGVAQTAADLAVEQITATLSIEDMIKNLLHYMLEKIYKVLNDTVGPSVEGIWGYLTGNDAEQQQMKEVENYKAGFKGWDIKDKEGNITTSADDMNRQMTEAAAAISTGVRAGGGKAIGTNFSKVMSDEGLSSISSDQMTGMIKARKLKGNASAEDVTSHYNKLLKEKGKTAALEMLGGAVEGSNTLFMEMAQQASSSGHISSTVKEAGLTRRAGTSEVEKHKFQAARDQAKQTDDDIADLYYVKTGKSAMPEVPGKSALAGVSGGITGLAGSFANRLLSPDTKAKAGVTASSEHVADQLGYSQEEVNVANAAKQTKTQKTQVETQKKATDALVESDEEKAARLEQATNQVYESTNDVLELLKKGIKFESNFLQGHYFKVLKDSTLESFRIALLEYAVVQAKMSKSEEFRDWMANYGENIATNIAQGNTDISKFTGVGIDDQKGFEKAYEGSRLIGGDINSTGLYKLHRGETVLNPTDAKNAKTGGTGNNVYNVNINVNGSNMTPQQFRGEVYSVLSDLERRS